MQVHWVGRFNVNVSCRFYTKQRLSKTCFRGLACNCAGNFSRWGSVTEFLNDPIVVRELMREFMESIEEGKWDDGRIVEFDYGVPVGWESTDDMDKYAPDAFEKFALDKDTMALRILPSLRHIRAPRTSLVTVVYELVSSGGNFNVSIQSIYPGRNVGEPSWDVMMEEQVVFFDQNHPGA